MVESIGPLFGDVKNIPSYSPENCIFYRIFGSVRYEWILKYRGTLRLFPDFQHSKFSIIRNARTKYLNVKFINDQRLISVLFYQGADDAI